MKRILVIILCVAVVTVVISRWQPNRTGTPTIGVSPSPSVPAVVTLQSVHTVSYGGTPYAYAIARPTRASDVELIPNFKNKSSAGDIKETHRCESVINGGFYTTADAPLGMFVSDNETLNTAQENPLINGYFHIRGNTSAITVAPPRNADIVLQNGPVLIADGTVMTLKINNDEHARRAVVGVTDDDSPVFITVYDPESAYMGPLLSDLPEVMRLINAKEKLHITWALNLDGGSASAFLSDRVSLGEFTHVGSIFCIK